MRVRIRGDAAVPAITHLVMQGWHINPQRVYLMGMSAGSFLSAHKHDQKPRRKRRARTVA